MAYRILVPLDGSTQSESVLPFLTFLASKTSIELELLRCFEPPSLVYGLPELDECLSEAKLRDILESYLCSRQNVLQGIPTKVTTSCAETSSEILARSESKDMVVLSSRGRKATGRWLIGSVTMRIARFCPKPVLIVPTAIPSSQQLNTMLIALDGSLFAERALIVGAKLAKAVGAKVVLYRAVPGSLQTLDPGSQARGATVYLEALEQKYPDQPTSLLVRSETKIDIAGRAEELGADLIVIGSHGLRDAARRVVGSVAEDTLHQAHCPVLVVH